MRPCWAWPIARRVHAANTFIWAQREKIAPDEPWLVFCSPPFAFYVERQAEMLTLIGTLFEQAPPKSVFVVEADEQFDMGLLPLAAEWDVRPYPPAVVAIHHRRLTISLDISRHQRFMDIHQPRQDRKFHDQRRLGNSRAVGASQLVHSQSEPGRGPRAAGRAARRRTTIRRPRKSTTS